AVAGHCVKIANQKGDVVRAFPEGGDLNGEEIQAVVAVAAAGALGDEFRKINVGGGDHADVHALGAVAAEAFEFLLMQHAKEFGLQLERDVADFVEKKRAAVG